MENKEERYKENKKKKGTMKNLENWKMMKKTMENVGDGILRYFIKINRRIECLWYLRWKRSF